MTTHIERRLTIVRILCIIAAVAAGACGRVDFDLSAAVDGPGPDGPEPDGPGTDLQAIQVEVPTFSTTSTGFVDVPGGVLVVPGSPDQRWLLLVNAGLASSSFGEVTVEARYLVDGVERGLGGTQNTVGGQPGPWQHFFTFTGQAGDTVVTVQLRDAVGATASISNLRLIAVPLPASADAHEAYADDVQMFSSPAFPSYGALHTLSFTPSAAGEYVLLGVVNASDAPALNDVNVRWRSPSGALWQDGGKNPRQAWQSLLLARTEMLPAGPATFSLETAVKVAGDTVQVRNARLLALRADAFASIDKVVNEPSAYTSTTAGVVVASLVPTSTASARAYLVVGNTMLREATTCGGAERMGRLSIDGTAFHTFDHGIDNCAYTVTYGGFYLTPTRPGQIEMLVASGNGLNVQAQGSALILVGLP